MQFAQRQIRVWRGTSHKDLHKALITASVGIGTTLAIHPVPEGTRLHQRYPGAWLVTHAERGHNLVRSPLPADETTAKMLVEYLSQHDANEINNDQLARQCATTGGNWVFLNEQA